MMVSSLTGSSWMAWQAYIAPSKNGGYIPFITGYLKVPDNVAVVLQDSWMP